MSFPMRALSPIAAAVLISFSGLATAQTTQSAPSTIAQQAFDIPALPAAQALQRFVEQTKFQLLYLPDVVSGVTTNPINGTMTAHDALERMLKGTGVVIVDTGAGAATLRPVGAAASNSPTSGDAAAAQKPVTELQSVVVTASKRATSERQLAGSVTALQGSDLEARGAVGFEEYLRQAPGVQYNKQEAGYSTLSIRGLSTTTGVATTQGTTGIYIEDVPFTDPYSVIALPDLGAFDLERIEVLRGPQGVLFGSASLGGALRFVLNKPNLKGNEASGEITGSQTSGGGANYGASVMGNWASSNQDFGLRIVGYDRKDSGYVKNVTTGDERVNSARQTGGRILATWKPLQQLSITGILMSEEGKLDDSSSVSPDPTKFETNVQTRQPRTLKTDFGNLQANYDFESIRLTSNTGYVRKGTEVATDLGRYLGPLFANQATDLQGLTSNSAHAFSQEIRIANRESGSVNWLVGAFYQQFKEHYLGAFLGKGVSAAAQMLYGPAFGVPLVQSLTANDSFYRQDIESVAKESAFFGDVEWRITPRWTVEGGARAYRTEIAEDSTTSGLLSFLSFGTEPKHENNSTSDHGITPKVSIKYTAENGDIWYALASNGYRFGGLNFVPPAPGVSNPTSFKSDKLWNYETGVRLSMLERRLFVDLTGYYMDWKNAQFNALRSDGFGYVDNVGKARSLGAEVALRYRATGNLTLGGGFAYTDAKTKVDSALIPAGARLPGTAHLQGLLDASYNFVGPFDSSGTATLTYSHVGKYYNDLQQTVQLGGYGVADLNVRFSYDRYELTLFARNIANEKGKIGAAAAPGAGFADYYLTKPRTVGVALRVDM